MIPEYSKTLETKEILSLDAIPLLIAKSLHVRANEEIEDKVKKMALECEVLSILRKNTEERPYRWFLKNITNRLYFRSSLALSLLCYQMGMPSHALAAYGMWIEGLYLYL